jgi:exportin-T
MSHIQQIPEAVRIAAATTGVAPELKQQAINYLDKVKELCEETYQVSGLTFPS